MQRTKSYRKNIVREITGSLGRFVSIFAIVALGTGFFAGLGATSPDMEYSVDKYYDDSAMFDLRVVSPLGLTQDDAAAIARTEGIASVMPAYCADVMMDVSEGVSLAARLHSLPDAQGLNRVTLLEGTLPSAPDECLVTRLKNVTAIPEIGSTITVAEETETEGVLTERTFTVTGIADSSCYFSIERDSTTLGSGTINMVLWLPEEAFALDAYAEIYALAEGAAALNAFDDAYETHVDDVQARLEALSAERIAARAEALTAEPRAELEKGRAELAENRAEAEKQLGDAEEALASARTQLEDNEAALAEQADALRAQGYTEAMLDAALASARSQLEAGWTEYEENAATYEENRAETERKLTDAQKQLDDAQAQIDAVGEAEWYVQDRGSNLSYVSFDGNSQKIAAIAVVFPVFFFLVAALVALTTMTRMVEEQRVQIGTFKALGYNNAAIAMKYLLYAGTSTLLGSVLGLVVGMQLFPRILWNAYGIMYLLPEFYAPFRWDYGLLAFFSTLLCTLAAAWSACRHSLRESAASLMLPKAPKAGKRVLLEYITPIWKRMRFTHKVTVRNLFRYKKRFFMTVVGIAGCTALLVTGFGLSDSINEILDKQYEELNHYDMLVMCTDEEAAESEDIRTILSHGTLAVHQENCEVSLSGKEMEAYLFVPETPEHLPDFL
ncbi:MAG: ABC transporter permease, partial [Oscillospiraceae bacterium]|nr:ABC transporter permease [Oscillospiraceae bacterium]